MSAERLREAAAVLRERAEAATPGRWSAQVTDSRTFVEVVSADNDLVYRRINDIQAGSDATYIATMHPGVGLALADWLDGVAGAAERKGVRKFARGYKSALIVADAILGGAS